ncbi:hypothetical protein [Negadavirga shengliensis]|uniref:hypothetical protein n=1 Tax=Negadavirga shengliensis TaxID=1389218 RepID=UPI003672B7ED
MRLGTIPIINDSRRIALTWNTRTLLPKPDMLPKGGMEETLLEFCYTPSHAFSQPPTSSTPSNPKTPYEPTPLVIMENNFLPSGPSIRKETGLNSKNIQQNPKITKRGPMLTTHPRGRDPRQSLPIPDS